MEIIALPSPRTEGPLTLEETLRARRSVREFAPDPLTQDEIGQLLWAAQGITDPRGFRTAPSAGALFPLEVYAVTGDGVFHYLPAEHALRQVLAGDVRPQLQAAALGQESVGEAPLVLVIAAVPTRTQARYGEERGLRYVDMEVGHAAQNVLLQAVALGLGSVPIGAFSDARAAAVLGLAEGEIVRYMLPVGRPR
jgi:SagB-type dehydrogenase family enzyme